MRGFPIAFATPNTRSVCFVHRHPIGGLSLVYRVSQFELIGGPRTSLFSSTHIAQQPNSNAKEIDTVGAISLLVSVIRISLKLNPLNANKNARVEYIKKHTHIVAMEKKNHSSQGIEYISTPAPLPFSLFPFG